MNSLRSYIFVLLSTVAGGAVLLLFTAMLMNQRTNDSYLYSLRENSETGCSSFSARRPDVFVIGDSHSYAGWDFNLIASALGTKKVSSCTMGAFYIETLPKIADTLDRVGVPHKIIYGTSFFQFTETKTKADQLKEHDKLLGVARSPFDLAVAYESIRQDWDWLEHPESSPAVIREKKLSFHSPQIEKVPEKSAFELMEKTQTRGKQFWLDYLKQVRFTESAAAQIDTFCSWVRERGVELYVVSIPESPFLRRLYREEDIEKYHALLGRFRACAKQVVWDDSVTYGIGNRHYLNRQLLSEFPYQELSSRRPEIPLKTAIVPGNIFDADHLNLVGAERFTQMALKKLGLDQNPRTENK